MVALWIKDGYIHEQETTVETILGVLTHLHVKKNRKTRVMEVPLQPSPLPHHHHFTFGLHK